MPSLISSTLRLSGVCAPNNILWISSELKRPARRTTIWLPSSSHSRTDPGPTPSFRRTSAGTEICPWAVSLERAIATTSHYHGNVKYGSSSILTPAPESPMPNPGPSAILGASAHVVDHSGLFHLSRRRILRLLVRRALSSGHAGRGALRQLLLLRPLG